MTTDIIFIDHLNLSATIGPDCWGRPRTQPISLSVYLHLTPYGFLSRAGRSDNVNDTINYGHLTKAVTRYVEGDGNVFDSTRQLINGVVDKTFELAGENGKQVRVLAEVPKIIPLALGGMVVETTVTREGQVVQRKVYVKDLSFAVVIGVNEPERHEKQRVVVNLEVYERENSIVVDYPGIVRLLANDVDRMDYLTLEKMVWEIARITCRLLGEQADKVTIRAQKPSALSFAHSSGVEMTRTLADFQTS
ncbi:hypothetical protein AX15_005954 [Amanita polypyramis BW_CC]|nr:hypothetical protein AX15_005954 [Amanita polypyramis BW_CC]